MPWSGRRAAFYGLLVGFAAVAVGEVVRPRQGAATVVDWEEVREIARSRLRGADRAAAGRLEAAKAGYLALASELEGPFLQFVGGPAAASVAMPAFEAVDRRGWLELNIDIIRRAVDPLIEAGRMPNSWLLQLGRAGIDRYMGYLLGFLGRRVLGQYDPGLLAVGGGVSGLYLVEPNVEEWRKAADLPQADLRQWLILHEMTHAWQFAAHPWLRGYMEDAIHAIADSMAPSQSPLARAAAFAGLMPAQWRVLRRVQAVMSVIEGYSNLVMNKLGAKLLPEIDRIEQAYRERSASRSPLDLLLWRLTGLELKRQQYQRGEAFCVAVYDGHGIDVLNQVWESPQNLPSLNELSDPERWVRRLA